MARAYVRDWIVIAGSLVDTTHGGGYEFFGPFTEEEANIVRDEMHSDGGQAERETLVCVQLIKQPNLLGEHWNPTHKPQVD